MFVYTRFCDTVSGAIISITLLHYLRVNSEMGNLRTYLFLQILCKYTHGLTLKFQFWGSCKNNIVLWIFIVQRGQKEAFAGWSLLRHRRIHWVRKPPSFIYFTDITAFQRLIRSLKLNSLHSFHTEYFLLVCSNTMKNVANIFYFALNIWFIG